MLGLGTLHREQTSSTIPPGSTLIFFTDGLTESTRDIGDGYRRLRVALADERVRGAANPARAIIEHVLDRAQARDDIAVLVVTAGTTRCSARGDIELAVESVARDI